MLVPRSWLKFGERAFSIGAPRAWNSLPADLRATVNTGTFRKKLKKFFTQILFNSLLNFYFVVLVVIGLVGHCCKLQPSVIIIIIIITASVFVWLMALESAPPYRPK